MDKAIAELVDGSPAALRYAQGCRLRPRQLIRVARFTTVATQIGQKVDKVAGRAFPKTTPRRSRGKPRGCTAGANNYQHPATIRRR